MSDIFRREYKSLSDEQQAHIDAFKIRAAELMFEFDCSECIKPDKARMDLAKFALEESIMWAIKSIT